MDVIIDLWVPEVALFKEKIVQKSSGRGGTGWNRLGIKRNFKLLKERVTVRLGFDERVRGRW